MTLKVMFFLPSLGGGGAEMNAVRLAGALKANAIEPIYVTARGGGSFGQFLPPDVRHVVLDTGAINSSSLRLLRSIGRLADTIDELRPDIVCPVLSRTSLAAHAAIARAKHKPRLVLLIQNSLTGQFSRGKGPLAVLERHLTRRWWPQADHVIALSRGVGEEVRSYLPELADSIDVVYNVGVPLEKQISEAARAPKSPAEGGLRLIACGRLTQQKDYPTLLRAFAQLRINPLPTLSILGKGPEEQALKTLAQQLNIAERVHFLGFQDDPFAHMRQADIMVLSSQWEGFANVVVEAMAMGTPVVATDCPHGPGEIITDGINGLLVAPGDPEALAEALERLILDEGLRARLAVAGESRAGRFTAERIGAEYASAFRQIAARVEEVKVA